MRSHTSQYSIKGTSLKTLSPSELDGIQGGTPPGSDANRFGYSIYKAPSGAMTGTITYERNLGKGYSAGADLTRQGGRTFGGIHFGGQAGSHGTWSAEVNRYGNETNFGIKGGWRL